MFSLALTRPTLATPTSGGLLAIGGVPNVDNDGQLITVPIQPVIAGSYAFYAIRIDGFVVLPRTAPSTVFEPQLPPSQNFTVTPIAAVVDSGSTLMYLPNNVTDYIAASFSPPAVFSEMTGMWMAGCGAVAPRVGIIIGGKTFWVDARDLINNETNGGGVRKTGLCAIASQRASAGDAVLGDAFLKNVIAVFDLGRNEMGFLGRTAV